MRLWVMVLADLAFGVGACSVEVAQRRTSEPVSLPIPKERPLDREFGLAISVDGRRWCAFGDRDAIGNTVNRTARREDEQADTGLAHGGQ